MDTKRVRIVDPNQPQNDRMVEVVPQDSASDVLRKAGLDPSDYFLMNPSTQQAFELTDSVAPSAVDGGKLHVVMQSKVGS
jgi:hypothetical protein